MAYPYQFKKNGGNKYHNKKVEYNGIKFDSKKEMQRYIVLKKAEEDGIISNLRMQVRYELIPAVKQTYIKHLKTKDKECEKTLQLPITYTCDFQYIKDGVLVIEDVKASPKMLPKEFVLKEKMMFALKNLKIKKVFSAKEQV
jgi:hypothetical protein